MKFMKQLKRGYILVLTLGIIALAMMMVTAVLMQSINYQKRSKVIFDLEQTRMLVLSGLAIAQSQFSFVGQKDSKDSDSQWIKQLLPVINNWQTIKLAAKDVSVDATITLYIACEDGKINLVDTAQNNLTATSNLLKKEADIDLDKLLKQLKESKTALDDVTQLKINKPVFELKGSGRDRDAIATTDLFTTINSSGKINPWVFSESLLKILGLKSAEKSIKELSNKFKPKLQFPADWNNIFAPIYGKNFESLDAGIKPLFSTDFEINGFGVICYAQVGKVIQKVYAVFEKDNIAGTDDNRSRLFKLSKLYWL